MKPVFCELCGIYVEQWWQHDCHCIHDEENARVAVGICCGHMLGEDALAQEDASTRRERKTG